MRAYLLTPLQRKEIREYLESKPRPAMNPRLRQRRHRVKTIDLKTIREDLELMEQLAALKLRPGRKPNMMSRTNQKGAFNVRHPDKTDKTDNIDEHRDGLYPDDHWYRG